MGSQESRGAFPTTNWADVRALDGSRGAESLRLLVESYLPAVYSFLRRRGLDRERAADVTQGFFADVVLARALFQTAAESRGKLRSLILTALKNYCVDIGRRERARGAGMLRPLEDSWLVREDDLLAQAPESADSAFERRVLLAVLEEALRRCETHFLGSGKRGHWMAFDARVLRPLLASVAPSPIDDVARVHGFASPADVSAAVQVVKRRLAALMQEVAAEHGVGPIADLKMCVTEGALVR